MSWLSAPFVAVGNYFYQGGEVLYLIAMLAFAMWTLILERLWYYRADVRADVSQAVAAWEARSERSSWHAHKVREKLISEASERIWHHLPMIKTMVSLAPLFGLLGTVWGMIQVFEIMAVTGGGDARQMASGVFKATIPTLSGMVVAIAGLFANTWINRKARYETQMLEDSMTMDH